MTAFEIELPHYQSPIVLAVISANESIPVNAALSSLAYQTYSALPQAALKLLPIGPTTTQQLLHEALLEITPHLETAAHVPEKGDREFQPRLGHQRISTRNGERQNVYLMIMEKKTNQAIRVGIGGPVGSGKSTLCLKLCEHYGKTRNMAVITNDIYTKEDAKMLIRHDALPEERILGVETGGCPHTAIRDDISMNLDAVDVMNERFDGLELILIESGGDNLTATFSPELVDVFIYVIDVTEGDDIPRKGGPAIANSGSSSRQQSRTRSLCWRGRRPNEARLRWQTRHASLPHDRPSAQGVDARRALYLV